MKHLRITITADHEETQEGPIRTAVAGFVPKLHSMGFGNATATVDMGGAVRRSVGQRIDPGDHTVRELAGMVSGMTALQLADVIVSEATGKRRKGAIHALADELKAR